MRRLALLLAIGGGTMMIACQAPAADAPASPGPPLLPPPPIFSATDTTSGQALYVRNCGVCHAAGGTGALTLAQRLGPDRAMLPGREDLAVETVIAIARSGVGNMPPIPAGSVSDKELRAIADYLTSKPGKP